MPELTADLNDMIQRNKEVRRKLRLATNALTKIADTTSTAGYLRDIRGGNADIAAAALAEIAKGDG